MGVTSALMWAALSGTFISLILSIIAGFIGGRFKKGIIQLIQNEIITKNKILTGMVITKDSFRQLQQLVSENTLPLEISFTPLTKKKVTVVIKPSEEQAITQSPTLLELSETTERLHSRLKSNLVYAEIAAITSIFALVLVFLSFIAILRPSSLWDLVAVAAAPFFLIISVASGILLGRIIKRFRLRKSKE